MSSGCKCGSSCSCGDDCKCSSMYPDLNESSTTTQTHIDGFSPAKGDYEGAEMGVGPETDGCKCGKDCSCDPCSCK